MFNVIRNVAAPICLSHNIYNDPTVTEALKKIFHGKCYLCEQARLSDPEIEHFIPHEGDPDLKYDWSNLFYSCSRCNSIKSNTHVNLLDCSNGEVDVSMEIVHLAPSLSSENVTIRAPQEAVSNETMNTIVLLNECFNSKNTGLRGITRENLMENLFNYHVKYLTSRQILIDFESTEQQIAYAKASLKAMCKISFPFSIFWKWHIRLDTFLLNEHPNLIEELGF
ncbi:HNH endonuclease [Serratia marcescens]|uniref:HNH endonuclease n=1 Tax=Serratia TaxID=613 RepID=UPI0027E5B8EE|nr:HNH endonuclease [Serratia marcescens]MCS1373861.1 HNH endonuclease [Serratia marcescens]